MRRLALVALALAAPAAAQSVKPPASPADTTGWYTARATCAAPASEGFAQAKNRVAAERRAIRTCAAAGAPATCCQRNVRSER